MSYFQQLALAGNCFIGSTAATGVDLPIYNATAAHTAVLWNPPGSGKNLILNQAIFAQADATTPVISGIGFSYLLNAVGPATGAAVVTFTDALAINAKLGGASPRARFGAASISATAFLLSAGLSQDSIAPAAGILNTVFNFNGCLIVPPGALIAMVGAPVAPGQAFTASFTWAEVNG